MGQVALLQSLDHWQESLVQACLGSRNQAFGLIQEGNPSVIVAVILDEAVTDTLKQSGAVLFLGEQFAYVVHGTQQKVEALYFPRFLLQLNLYILKEFVGQNTITALC